MFDARVKLKEWRADLKRADARCPYVGPRPQTAADGSQMLVGREADIERINNAVLRRSLVLLDGESGVGKSSLLQNGLLDRFRGAGFAVLVSRKWSEVPENFVGSLSATEQYVAQCIALTHADALTPTSLPNDLAETDLLKLAEEGGLCSTLDKQYADSGALVILDQFEELLRQHGAIAKSVVDWIINIGYRHDTHVVISLRTDSLYRLEPLLRGVRPFTMDRVTVTAIADRASIEQVIQRPRQSESRTSKTPMSEEVAAELLTLWEKHGPSLLHLQATLYALHFRALTRLEEGTPISADPGARTARGAGIDSADLRAFLEDGANRSAAGTVCDPFMFGLTEAIRLKIHHAEAASRRTGIDDYLVCGTRDIVRRSASFLSSGGFKVPVRDLELAEHTLIREVGVLQQALLEEWQVPGDYRPPVLKEIVAKLHAALADSEDLLVASASDALSHLGHKHTRQSRRNAAVSAGPMMSASASATLFEELRRVAFAIEWLQATEIVRRDPNGTLLLVHDGAGRALIAWRDAQLETPTSALRQLTAARGEHYVWRELEIGGKTSTVIANLNWRECRIAAGFRNVVFVNCDFSGSRFDECTFEGVTFVNCLLDDANFEYCEISGATTLERVDRRRVGSQQDNSPHLDLGAGATRPVTRTPTSGGVAMLGGRLCFLTLYRCRSVNGGSFAFHHVSGDGLDIVEQYGGTIDLHDAAVRGISISRDTDAGSSYVHRVSVTVNESIIANTYFSGELRGEVRISNSRALMLINASENCSEGLEVELDDCRYQFLANAGKPTNSSEATDSPTALARALEQMDYRARPAVWEANQRLRKARADPGQARLAPSFTVEASTAEVRNFTCYAGDRGQTQCQFFSDTSGAPAVVGAAPPDFLGDLIAHFNTTPKVGSR